jgi:hypothetical protein
MNSSKTSLFAKSSKFYDGPADGKPNAAYGDALAAHREAVGTRTESERDFEVWQAFLPNRFAREPRLEANTPLELPGAQRFKVAAGGDGVTQQTLGCLATEREIYNDLPPPLRWGDFEDIKLGTFEEIRDAFLQVAKGPVTLEGAVIEVVQN